MANNRNWVLPAVTLVVLVALVGLIWKWETRPDSAGQAPATQPAVRVPPAASEDGIHVFFSPRGNATDAVIEQIDQATRSLRIQAYQFTSAPIATAVVNAHKRGVKIVVLLDPSQESERYKAAQFLHNEGIEVHIDRKHAANGIAHNKVMLIDGRTVITGSFNFTKAAEQDNAENLLIMVDKPVVYAAYEKNFVSHLKHAEQYQGKPQAAQEPRPKARRSAPSR